MFNYQLLNENGEVVKPRHSFCAILCVVALKNIEVNFIFLARLFKYLR